MLRDPLTKIASPGRQYFFNCSCNCGKDVKCLTARRAFFALAASEINLENFPKVKTESIFAAATKLPIAECKGADFAPSSSISAHTKTFRPLILRPDNVVIALRSDIGFAL